MRRAPRPFVTPRRATPRVTRNRNRESAWISALRPRLRPARARAPSRVTPRASRRTATPRRRAVVLWLRQSLAPRRRARGAAPTAEKNRHRAFLLRRRLSLPLMTRSLEGEARRTEDEARRPARAPSEIPDRTRTERPRARRRSRRVRTRRGQRPIPRRRGAPPPPPRRDASPSRTPRASKSHRRSRHFSASRAVRSRRKRSPQRRGLPRRRRPLRSPRAS